MSFDMVLSHVSLSEFTVILSEHDTLLITRTILIAVITVQLLPEERNAGRLRE